MKKKQITIILIILVGIVIMIACLGLRGCSDTKEDNQVSSGEQSDLGKQEEEDKQDDKDTPTNSTVSSDTVTEEEFENGSQNSTSGNMEQMKDDKDNASSAEKDSNVSENEDTNSDEEQENTGDATDEATYTITYVLNYSNATIEATTQEVKANETFTLFIPTVPKGDDYSFVKWVITGTNTEVTNGIFTFNNHISLTAVWEDTYSKNY